MITEKQLRQRTIASFAVLLLLFVVGFFAWSWITHSADEDDISRPLRAVLEWNGRLWQRAVGSTGKFPPPPVGKRPRVNGDLGLESSIDLSSWKLEVVDSRGKQLDLTMEQIHALPRTESIAEFRCIEGWSEVVSYAGVKFEDLIKSFDLDGKAEFVGLSTPDEKYYVSIDTVSALHPQTILAYEMNGQPLSLDNGAPLRLVIPIKYGIKSLKRIGKIFFSATRPPDYWAELGYDWYAGL